MTPLAPESVCRLADAVAAGCRTGVPPSADELHTRFPDLAADLPTLAGLVRALEVAAEAERRSRC